MMPPSPGITKANFDRINKGTELTKVEEIFGAKGEDLVPRMAHGKRIIAWRANDGAEAHVFFQNSAVISSRWFDSTETFPDKIRRWLHLP